MHPTYPLKKQHYASVDKITVGKKGLSFLIYTALLYCVLFFYGCGFDIEDPNPPLAPHWVEKSHPEDWPERGIDAHESGGIILEWDPSPEENIRAYSIYKAEYVGDGDSLGEYIQIYNSDNTSTSDFKFIDTDVNVNTKYYYKLQAEDISGNKSGYSETLSYTLLPQIILNVMTPSSHVDTLNHGRYLSWRYSYLIEMENYCLTLLTQNDTFIFRAVLSPGNYIDGSEQWQVPDSIHLVHSQVYKWRIDTGGKYLNNLESAGSESPWASFLEVDPKNWTVA